MKSISKIILSLLAVVLFVSSCKEDKTELFDSTTNVYFRHKKWGATNNYNLYAYKTTLVYDGVEYNVSAGSSVVEARDSSDLSFAGLDAEIESIITFLPVTIVGNVAPVDRKFGYKIRETSTAVEGEDFEILDAFIPAGKIHGGIVIKGFKKNVVQENVYRNIDLELIENENFTVLYDSIPRSATKKEKVSTLTFRLKISNSLIQSSKWKNFTIGYFTTKKALCFMDVAGMTIDEYLELVTWRYTTGELSVFSKLFKNWLEEQAANDTPVRERNGGLMNTTDIPPAADPAHAE